MFHVEHNNDLFAHVAWNPDLRSIEKRGGLYYVRIPDEHDPADARRIAVRSVISCLFKDFDANDAEFSW